MSPAGQDDFNPGTVTTVAIGKKSFKRISTRASITGVRIKTGQGAG